MFGEEVVGLEKDAFNETAASWKIPDIFTPWLGVGVARDRVFPERRFLALFGAVPTGVLSDS